MDYAKKFKNDANRIDMLEKALNEWLEKTEWVQKTSHGQHLGMHRADVMKQRIERLEAKLIPALHVIGYINEMGEPVLTNDTRRIDLSCSGGCTKLYGEMKS